MLFRSTIIDGFFDDPYKVRELGLEVAEHTPIDKNQVTYRGERSACLSKIHPVLFDQINRKILSSFYDLNKEDISWKSETSYQLTNGSFGDGWVHTDYYRGALLTGIIYLTPNAPLNSGTSLYQVKNIAARTLHDDVKRKGNANLELRNSKYYLECKRENNHQFEKTLTVNNLFNRLFVFDSSYYHCADHFFGNTREDSRLTLVTFINELFVNQTPITRIRSI